MQVNTIPEDPAVVIERTLQQQETLYNDLFASFYDPLQSAQERQNAQEIDGLRERWSQGNFPEQDRFSMEIQTLRDTLEEYRNDPNVQELIVDLASRVEQLESMHEDITNDLLYANIQRFSGGRRRSTRKGKKSRKNSRRSKTSKKSIRKRPCPM